MGNKCSMIGFDYTEASKGRKDARMDQLDHIFGGFETSPGVILPVIACLFTGPLPPYASAMLRDPAPAIGTELNERFPDVLREALQINSAVHDGAIMLGRDHVTDAYAVAGWSFRLYPPEFGVPISNRGSAFNSCLAMSAVRGIDRIFLVSREGLYRFSAGEVLPLSSS